MISSSALSILSLLFSSLSSSSFFPYVSPVRIAAPVPMSDLILYTGNTLQTKLLGPSTSISQHLHNVLQYSVDSTNTLRSTGTHIVGPSPSSFCTNGNAATPVNKNNEITAKLFLPKGVSVEQAIANVQTAIHAFQDGLYKGTQIKYFILSFGGVIFSDDEEDENQSSTDDEIYKVWQATVEAGNNERLEDGSTLIKEYGVSEFSTRRLETLLNKISDSPNGVKPTINHINAADCCALPQSLVTLAKSLGIKLLAHHDPENLLPQKEVDALTVEIREKLESKADKDHQPLFTADRYQWNWILKMTHLARDRQVLIRNEALVGLGPHS